MGIDKVAFTGSTEVLCFENLLCAASLDLKAFFILSVWKAEMLIHNICGLNNMEHANNTEHV